MVLWNPSPLLLNELKWNARLTQDAPDTEREDRYLVLQCRRNRKNTSGELGKSIANEDGAPKVTDRTICNRLPRHASQEATA